jgi:hypothetical protein
VPSATEEQRRSGRFERHTLEWEVFNRDIDKATQAHPLGRIQYLETDEMSHRIKIQRDPLFDVPALGDRRFAKMDVESIDLLAIFDSHGLPPPLVLCRTTVITKISSAVSRNVIRIVP